MSDRRSPWYYIAPFAYLGFASTYPFRTYHVPPPMIGYAFGSSMLVGASIGTWLLPYVVHRLALAGHRGAVVKVICFAIPIAAAFHIGATLAASFLQAVVMA